MLVVLLMGPLWAAPSGAGLCFPLTSAGEACVCCEPAEGACCNCCESTPKPVPRGQTLPHDCGCCIDVPVPDLPRLPKLSIEAARVLEIVLAEAPLAGGVHAVDYSAIGQRWALPPPDRPESATELGLKSVRLLI